MFKDIILRNRFLNERSKLQVATNVELENDESIQYLADSSATTISELQVASDDGSEQNNLKAFKACLKH